MLVRSEGAATAAATTALEVTSAVGTAGTLTPASAATGLIADLASLTWIQVRMVLIIAALHGHDPRNPDRLKEIFSLMGVYRAQREATSLAGAVSQRVIRRLILRHLKGDSLRAIKGMFRVVGINFNRTGLIKIVPGVNVPISVVMNGSATAALGRKANKFYKELPA